MRLAVTADLHWGVSPRGDAASRALAARVLELAPEVFAIAGDIGEGPCFRAGLRLFAGLACPRLLVPGNHDLWVREPGASSLERYERALPREAAAEGFHTLDVAPFIAPDGREAVVGSINWYDYSFADPELAAALPDIAAMYREKRFPSGRHNDGCYVRLGMSDEAFTALVVDRLAAQLAALPPSVERVTAILHHPPVRDLFYPTPLTTLEQRVWLAYTGNRRMAALLLGDPRVNTLLCGHTHAFCAAEVAGRRCRNIGGDYTSKRLLWLDTETGEEHWWEFR